MWIKSKPTKNNRGSCFCAYCNFWEGECGLKLRNSVQVEFDNTAKGKCTKTGNARTAGYPVCQKFEFSPFATKYIR